MKLKFCMDMVQRAKTSKAVFSEINSYQDYSHFKTAYLLNKWVCKFSHTLVVYMKHANKQVKNKVSEVFLIKRDAGDSNK